MKYYFFVLFYLLLFSEANEKSRNTKSVSNSRQFFAKTILNMTLYMTLPKVFPKQRIIPYFKTF